MPVLQDLLSEIVDYAGLFPPAALPMQQAVNNFAKYVESEQSWMLGRFVVPAGKLDEFESAANDLLPKSTIARGWRLSALLPPVDAENDGFLSALQKVHSFNRTHATSDNGFALIDSLEVKANSINQINEIAAFELPEGECFVEIDHRNDPDEFIAALQQHTGSGLRAKIRTGGVEPTMIPPSAEVARFITRCAQHKVAFKATAGLHHPIRNEFPLTYEPDAPCATMHGFLNVFLAACLAWESSGENENQLIDVLQSAEVEMNDSGISVSGHQIDLSSIELVRSSFARSFGSCSFSEPVEDLSALGVLQTTGSI